MTQYIVIVSSTIIALCGLYFAYVWYNHRKQTQPTFARHIRETREYLCVDAKGWHLWWGLRVSSEKLDTDLLNDYHSKGWELHSFSLRNGMMPNIPLTKMILVGLAYIFTLGFVTYMCGSTFIFKKKERKLSFDKHTL